MPGQSPHFMCSREAFNPLTEEGKAHAALEVADYVEYMTSKESFCAFWELCGQLLSIRWKSLTSHSQTTINDSPLGFKRRLRMQNYIDP